MSAPTPSPLALSIATALADNGRLYWTSSAVNDPNEVATVAAIIDDTLLPRLAAHADAIEAALGVLVSHYSDEDAGPGGDAVRALKGALHL